MLTADLPASATGQDLWPGPDTFRHITALHILGTLMRGEGGALFSQHVDSLSNVGRRTCVGQAPHVSPFIVDKRALVQIADTDTETG